MTQYVRPAQQAQRIVRLVHQEDQYCLIAPAIMGHMIQMGLAQLAINHVQPAVVA